MAASASELTSVRRVIAQRVYRARRRVELVALFEVLEAGVDDAFHAQERLVPGIKSRIHFNSQ